MEGEEHAANTITIRGFPVCFPKGKKPFAPQLALMSKLLVGVQKSENCLLESPTGTGKTLALLCAAVAWQKHQRENATIQENESESESESESEGEDKPMIADVEGQPLRSFNDFRYVADTNAPAASDCTDKRKPHKGAAVEVAYEDGSVGSSEEKLLGQEDVAGCFGDDDDDAFESPKQKRQKAQEKSGGKAWTQTSPYADAQGTPKADAVKPACGTSSPMTAEESSCGGVEGKAGVRVDPARGSPSPEGCAATVAKVGVNNATSIGPTPVPAASERTKQSTKGKKMKRPRKRAPRVYFCSRTHSQLNQVVAELRTCGDAFRNTSAVGIGEDGKPFSMALLASRKSTCINAEACNDPKGVDDACKRLLKDKGCTYQRRTKWAETKLPPVWDVEDAVRLGKENQTCPYYTARDSLVTADLILCPYNYLVDPGVREIMGIKLKNAVVIFDEAHNLEDSAREAASAKLSLRALASAANEMQKLGENSLSMAPAYATLRQVIVNVQAFLEETDGDLNFDNYEKAFKVFSGVESLGLMQSRAGVTPDLVVELKAALSQVMSEDANADASTMDEEDQRQGQGQNKDVLSSGAVRVTSGLVKVLGFLLTEDMGNVEHYKMVVLREKGPWQPAAAVRGRGRHGKGRGGRAGSFGRGGTMGAMETYLCFWCQSAGVCFSEIDKQAHSIVLTSGTLSPLDSFAGELGIEFKHRLEAPHVINVAKQCLVTSVGYMDGVSLDARYTNHHKLKYQDALGNALLQYASVVPGGILVFFPSYGLMNKMHDRWKATTLLQAVEAFKAVYVEPRGQGKIDGVLAEYCGAIKAARDIVGDEENCEIESSTRRTGALMLAVARGKVSEGIDFSDDAARMCVIVGIPYPSSKDLQVMLKKEYQNHRRQTNTQLVGGGAWYNLQAFRAVNQAVGRCIRHRDDFGAIVLCDPRYGSQPETTASLSKWVRSTVTQSKTVETSLPQVRAFFEHHQEYPRRGRELAPASVRPVAVPTGVSGCGGGGSGGICSGSDGCEQTSDSGHILRGEKPNGSASDGSPRSRLRQQLLPQMFWSTSRTSTIANGESASPNRVMHPDRFMSGSGQRSDVVACPNPGAIDSGCAVGGSPKQEGRHAGSPPLTSAKSCLPQAPGTCPAPPVSYRRCPGFYGRIAECRLQTLTSPPPSLQNGGEQASRPRRVAVRDNFHLYDMATSLGPLGSQATGKHNGSNAVLLEAPRSWTLGDYVLEGHGVWAADDGLVYAPLLCSCPSCGSKQVGVKAVGAGLGGEDLIGRAWFFDDHVEADGVGSLGTLQQLMLPTHVAVLESLVPRHLR